MPQHSSPQPTAEVLFDAGNGISLHSVAEGNAEGSQHEDEEEAAAPSVLRRAWHRIKEPGKIYLQRRHAIKAFLRAVKEGNTTDALQCLANFPFLLTYTSFAKDGDTVWHLLAEYGDILLLQALTNYCKIHRVKSAGPKSRRQGGQTEKDVTIRSLVNVCNNLNQTPLMFAAYHGRSEVVTFLLKQGANPWAADRCGKRTALHYACLKGHAACAHALLEGIAPEDKVREGCSYTDVRSASGFTPLHFAVASNCVPAARVLLLFDAHVDHFNMFDAGEFWISCATKSTPLHIAAVSNRLHCAMTILQYYARHRIRLNLEDPRVWCDKKGHTPLAIARLRGHKELAALLVPGSEIPKDSNQLDGEFNPVQKLQVMAASTVKALLLASIQEAEEFMKLLGTYQQHGRVFARVAYDSNGQEQASTSAAVDMFIEADPTAGPQPQWSRTMMAGGTLSMSLAHRPSTTALSVAKSSTGLRDEDARGGGQLDQRPGSSQPPAARGGESPAAAFKGQQRSSGFSKMSGMSGTGARSSSGMEQSQGHSTPKDRKQAALKQWLSYERKAVAEGRRAPRRGAALQERSILSQISPADERRHGGGGACGAAGAGGRCLSSLLCWRPRPVYLPPQAGEDVCGLCQDNKPLLQMEPCGHHTCLLCAKSLCYLLDLQQLVLCPFCGSLVTSFGLG